MTKDLTTLQRHDGATALYDFTMGRKGDGANARLYDSAKELEHNDKKLYILRPYTP